MSDSASRLTDFYPSLNVVQMNSLGNAGGLSGAELWHWKTLPQAPLQTAPIQTAPQAASLILDSDFSFDDYLLRKWPAGTPSPDHLSWIHRVITHAYHEGCSCLAPPIRNRAGDTWTRLDGNIWEVSQWKPGVANFRTEPNERKLENMMRTLARFHKAAAQVNLDFNHSNNFQSRYSKLKELATNPKVIDRYRKPDSMKPGSTDPFAGSNVLSDLWSLQRKFLSHASRLAERLCAEVESGVPLGGVFPIQPVLRDIWNDHVLFVGNEVTGLIDYGAMQMDIVSLDIARLLGSTLDSAFHEQPERWAHAIEVYRQVRPLSQPELDLIPWLDQVGVLLGARNWLEWLLMEERNFSDWTKVSSRLQTLNQRLQTAGAL